MSKKLIALLILVILLVVVIICYWTQNEFWIGPTGYFRYYNQFYPKVWRKTISNPVEPFTVGEIYNKNNNDKIFSVSIYGTHSKYYNGLKKLIETPNHYPEWTFRVYCHSQVTEDFKNYLKSKTNVETRIVYDDHVQPGGSAGAIWRFLPLAEDITFLTLDVDEAINLPYGLIDRWLNSDKGFFRLDLQYPWARVHMCGKYFGRKKGYSKVSYNTIRNFPVRTPYGADEICLQVLALPQLEKDGVMTYHPIIIHDIIDKIGEFLRRNDSIFGKYKNIYDEVVKSKYHSFY